MNTSKLIAQFAAMLTMGLVLSSQGFALESALPKKSEPQSQVSKSVQVEVNKKTADAAAEKRKELIADAYSGPRFSDNKLRW